MDVLIENVQAFISHEWTRDIFWAVVIAVATAALSHVVCRSLNALLNRDDVPLPSSTIIINIVRTVIWVIGASVILDSCFGINPNAVVTALGVGGIAVSLGFQDTLSNLIGGIQMTFMKLVKPGDNIEVSGSSGVVEDVTWRHTAIRTKADKMVVIPNSVISKNALTRLPEDVEVKVPFTVSDGTREADELARALEAAAQGAAAKVCEVTESPQVLFSEVTESGFKGATTLRIRDLAKVDKVADAVARAIARETQKKG